MTRKYEYQTQLDVINREMIDYMGVAPRFMQRDLEDVGFVKVEGSDVMIRNSLRSKRTEIRYDPLNTISPLSVITDENDPECVSEIIRILESIYEEVLTE